MKHDSQSQGYYFFNEMKLKLKMHVLGHKQWKRGGKVDYLSRIIVCVKGFHAYKIFHSKPILPLPLKYVTCSSTLNKPNKKQEEKNQRISNFFSNLYKIYWSTKKNELYNNCTACISYSSTCCISPLVIYS